jgi:predicted enzyme related to lactoylglutathione lyase
LVTFLAFVIQVAHNGAALIFWRQAMSEAKPRGRFVWYDLMTSDPEKAIEFYTKLTGWGTTKWEGPTPYTMWTNSSVPIGGVMPLPPEAGAPPHWLAYISSPDADATAKDAEALGAKVLVAPNDIPTVGRFAVLSDPQGALFAIFTPQAQAPGHEGPAVVGEFSWHELMTHDQPAAFRFYERLFGWEKTTAMDMGEMGVYQMYGRNGVELGGMFNKPPDMPGPPAWSHYILVDDITPAAEFTSANGGKIVNGPMEVPGGDWIFQAFDPQGAFFAVHAKKKS